MSKRKRFKHQLQQPNSKLFFSLPSLRIVKNAVCLFESVLMYEPEKLPNVPFAKEVVAGLKIKLDEMLQSEEWEKETPLDYNEVFIIYASVQMYLLDLQLSHQDTLILPCLALCQQFALIVEQTDVKQIADKAWFK